MFLFFGGGDFIDRFVASSEADIIVLSTTHWKEETRILTAEVGISFFCINQKSNRLAFIDQTGTISIITINTTSLNSEKITSCDELRRFSGICSKEVTLGDSYYCLASWFTRDTVDFLAAPTYGGSIMVIVIDGDVCHEKTIVPDSYDENSHGDVDMSITLFSPDGKYLLSADIDGYVVVRKVDYDDIENSKAVKKFKVEGSKIINLQYIEEDEQSYLLIMTADSWTKVAIEEEKQVETATQLDQSQLMDVVPSLATQMEDYTQPTQIESTNRNLMSTELSQEDTSNVARNTNSPAKEATEPDSFDKLRKLGKPQADDDDDLFGNLSPQKDSQNVRKERRTQATEIDDNSDALSEVDDDVDVDVDIAKNASVELLSSANYLNPVIPTVELQKAFQPSSTKFDEKNRKYLVWNSIGSITLREDSLDSRIEIRFANSNGTNRHEAFSDRTGFTMASLSYEGAVFASDPEEIDEVDYLGRSTGATTIGKGSIIYYHAFPGQKQLEDIQDSFRFNLSDGEAAVAVAVGKGWVAVATSKDFLRVFSSAGLQIATRVLHGNVVCLAGYDEQLAVIYHAGMPIDDKFVMRLNLYEMKWKHGSLSAKTVSDFYVPLSKGGKLDWVGFDVDLKLFVIVDSIGLVSALVQCPDWDWIPILDIAQARKAADHKFWPVMVRCNKLVYVLLNGESMPAVYPQPVVSVKALRIPLLAQGRDGKEAETFKEKQHQQLWQYTLAEHFEKNTKQLQMSESPLDLESAELMESKLQEMYLENDKIVLKLLQEACQAKNISMALNLSIRLKTEKALQGAITIANHFGQTKVAFALEVLIDRMEQMEQMRNNCVEEVYNSQEVFDSDEPMNYSNSNKYADEENYDNYQDDIDDEPGMSLSSKASARLANSKSRLNKVSPAAATISGAKKNPFAIQHTGTTPVKRKNNLSSIDELKASPSPKRPTLNVSISYSVF